MKTLRATLILPLLLASFTASNAAKLEYKVSIVTPNIKKADTRAVVSMRIVGTKGSKDLKIRGGIYSKKETYWCVKRKNGKIIKKEKRFRNKFERHLFAGCTDVMTFEQESLGTIIGIYVSHDNSGKGPGWYLGYVKVECDSKSVVFPCHRWLAKTADDGKISRYLEPDHKLIRYIVRVHTDSREKAGTSARVRIDIEGTTNNEISSWQLDCPGNPFEKGNVDVFNIYCKDLGELKRLRVAQDGSGKGSGWFLNKIGVQRVNPPVKHWRFRFERWLDGKRGQSATSTL